MGSAFVEIHVGLRARLLSDPALSAQVEILNPEAEPGEDGIVITEIASPILGAGDNGVKEIVVGGDQIRFQRWIDA